MLITTTLGSCLAACLWQRARRVGGMNHFMLPEGSGDSGRYGSCAMELLINAMVKRLAPAHTDALVAQDSVAAQRAAPANTGGGSVDLF